MSEELEKYQKIIQDGQRECNIFYEGKRNRKRNHNDFQQCFSLLDEILENQRNDLQDVEKIIYIVRTVFKDWEEKSLFLSYRLNTTERISFSFEEKCLKAYHRLVQVSPNLEIEIKLSEEKPLQVFLNEKAGKTNHKIPQIASIIRQEIDFIERVENTKPKVTLTEEEQLFCNIYYQFFQSSPNFSKKEDCKKAEWMMYLLNKYGIDFKKDKKVLFLHPDIFFYQTYFKPIFFSLAPLGDIEKTNFPQLSSFEEKVVVAVGNEIRNILGQEKIGDNLEQLCLIDYLRYSDNKNFCELNLPIQEFEKKVKLMKKINEMVHDMN